MNYYENIPILPNWLNLIDKANPCQAQVLDVWSLSEHRSSTAAVMQTPVKGARDILSVMIRLKCTLCLWFTQSDVFCSTSMQNFGRVIKTWHALLESACQHLTVTLADHKRLLLREYPIKMQMLAASIRGIRYLRKLCRCKYIYNFIHHQTMIANNEKKNNSMLRMRGHVSAGFYSLWRPILVR